MPLLSALGAASARGWVPRGNGPISGARLEVWSGGSTNGPGGTMNILTSATLVPGSAYVVTVGAADANSTVSGTGVSLTAACSNAASGHIVNGTVTSFQSGSDTQVSGYSGQYYPPYNIFAYGGKPGAYGNGAASSGYYARLYGGNGGSPIPTLGDGIAGFVSAAGAGGGGGINPGQWPIYTMYCDWDGFCYYYQVDTGYGFYGNTSYYGPNTGNGAGGSGAIYYQNVPRAASSGGFMMQYSAALPPLAVTTGTVTYSLGGGLHRYFWTTSGSFSV